MTLSDATSAHSFLHPRIVEISPALAAELLSRSEGNRPVDAGQVAIVAGEIKKGNWQITHQGVALDGPLESGSVLDGQHRLHAIIKAGVTIPVLVFENVPRKTFSVLDTGKRRSAADVLSLSQQKDTMLLASTIRHVHLFRTSPSGAWVGSSSRVSNDRILEIFNAQQEEFVKAVTVGRLLSQTPGLIPTAAAAGYFLTVESAPVARVDSWLEGVTTGANLASDDPRLALIKVIHALRAGASNRRRTDTRGQIGLYIKAWNAWVSGRPVKALRLQKGEKMPRPVQMTIIE